MLNNAIKNVYNHLIYMCQLEFIAESELATARVKSVARRHILATQALFDAKNNRMKAEIEYERLLILKREEI